MRNEPVAVQIKELAWATENSLYTGMFVRIVGVPVVHLNGELPNTSQEAFLLQPTLSTKSNEIIVT